MQSDTKLSKKMARWNQTKHPFPDQLTLQQCFEQSVEKHPDHVALVYEDQSLTYQALNEKANQLAHLIRTQHEKIIGKPITPDVLIAFCCNRSFNIIIFMLAILKSGGAYVPLDANYPEERLTYILKDTGTSIVITEQALSNLPCFTVQSLICVDNPQTDWSALSTDNPKQINKSTDLAYIIYTSGSTGKPKGVMIEHRGVVNLAHEGIREFQLKPSTKALQFASVNFDSSVPEIFAPLLAGSALYIAPQDKRQSAELMWRYLKNHQINCGALPPALLSLMPLKPLPDLHTLIVAGEACPQDTADNWRKGRQFVNAYGPTETTVCPAMKTLDKATPIHCIGGPIANVQCYVLNEHLEAVDVELKGELYVGGIGLARGYLNRPDLTAERFIPSPFDKNKRLYKTGDLVKWTESGELLYIGRNDFQVKIRGYRVELGEIETAIQALPRIQQSLVLLKTHQQKKHLVAYFTADIAKLDTQTIQSHLHANLPDYMVPAFYIQMDKFPLTLNGKLNRRALPDPDFSMRATQSTYVAPTSDIEKQLVKIWQQVLGVDPIGIEDNFFQLGGNSLQVASITLAIEEALGIHITVAEFFTAKTIQTLTTVIESNTQKTINRNLYRIDSVPIQKNALLPCSFSEQLIIQILEKDAPGMNEAMSLSFSDDLNITHLELALNAALSSYDVFHAILHQASDGICKKQAQLDDYRLRPKPVTPKALQQNIQVLLSPFNLFKESFVRIDFFEIQETEKSEYVLVIVMNHLIYDMRSLDYLCQTLSKYYSELQQNGQLKQIPLTVKYSDFSYWQTQFLKTPEFTHQLALWQKKLSTISPQQRINIKKNIGLLHPQNTGQAHPVSTEKPIFKITPSLSTEIKNFSKNAQISLNAIFVYSYTLLLMALTGESHFTFVIPYVYRKLKGTETLVGNFVQHYIFTTDIDQHASLQNGLDQCFSELIALQEIQDVPTLHLLSILQKLGVDPTYFMGLQILFQGEQDSGETLFPTIEYYERQFHAPHHAGISIKDFTIHVIESGTPLQFTLVLEVDDHISLKNAQKIADCYTAILETIVQSPTLSIYETMMLYQS